MKPIVLIGAIALLAACGSSTKEPDANETGGATSAPSDDVSSAACFALGESNGCSRFAP